MATQFLSTCTIIILASSVEIEAGRCSAFRLLFLSASSSTQSRKSVFTLTSSTGRLDPPAVHANLNLFKNNLCPNKQRCVLRFPSVFLSIWKWLRWGPGAGGGPRPAGEHFGFRTTMLPEGCIYTRA